MRNRFQWAILVFLLLFTAFPVPGNAAGRTNLMLIFDASGSMWGQINGKPKITIAKEAMDLIVNDLPDTINIGLVAYGHRRKGDCNDVETLIPLGPLNVNAFLARINSLNPKGKTPMVRSIRKTAEAIKHLEDETTILLVSDGEETCDPDPCNFVAELEKLGIKFVLHVVGFDVGGQTEAQLKCMAKAGGGEYFPAKDAAKLKGALDTVIEKTVSKNLKVSFFLNGEPIGASVEVTDPNTGQRVAYTSYSPKRTILMNVKPGTYRVTVFDEWQQEGRPKKVFENVQITETEVKELTANFGSGTLEIWNMKNGKPLHGRVKVTGIDNTSDGGGWKTTFQDKPAIYKLQPGKYKVVAEDSWGSQARKELGVIEIEAGQTIKKSVSFDSGKLVVWLYNNGKPLHGRVNVTGLDGSAQGAGWGTTYEDRPVEYVLMPGKYKVVAEDSWGSQTRKEVGVIEVAAGQTIKKSVSFDSGKLVIWTHKNGKPFHASVKVVDMNGKTMGGGWGTTYLDRPAEYVLQPGIYKVTAEDAWGDPVVKYEFGYVEIKPGHTLNKICDFNSPPPQNQTPPAPTSTAPASSNQTSAQAATAGSPKQTERETVPQSTANPQDMQAMAAQMQAQANAAQADAMAQMQAAMAQMQGNQLPQSPQTPAQQAQASARETHGAVRPGAQASGQVGAPETDSDTAAKWAAMEARDTAAPEGFDERPEQGHNPYEGMSKEEMQAAFARDMNMQGPQGSQPEYKPDEFKVGNPLTTKRHISTLGYRLNSCEEKAKAMNSNDILNRIEVARGNLLYLNQRLKKRAPKEELQRLLDRCAAEVNSIKISVNQMQ